MKIFATTKNCSSSYPRQLVVTHHISLDSNLVTGTESVPSGCPYIISIVDTYTSCIVGIHIGFEKHTQHEGGA